MAGFFNSSKFPLIIGGIIASLLVINIKESWAPDTQKPSAKVVEPQLNEPTVPAQKHNKDSVTFVNTAVGQNVLSQSSAVPDALEIKSLPATNLNILETVTGQPTIIKQPPAAINKNPLPSAVPLVDTKASGSTPKDSTSGSPLSTSPSKGVIPQITPAAIVKPQVPLQKPTISSSAANTQTLASKLIFVAPQDKTSEYTEMHAETSSPNLARAGEAKARDLPSVALVAVAGDKAWVRINPTQTVVVHAGESLPNLGKVLSVSESEILTEKGKLTLKQE